VNGTIVCVASSDEDGHLVRAAAELADQFDARLVLLGIARDAAEPIGTEGLGGAETPAGVRARLAAMAAGNGVGDRAEHRVEVGDPVGAVVDVADEEAAGMIVIGASPGLRKRTLRSVFARDLAEAAPCPVVVVPPVTRAWAGTRSSLVAARPSR
jgi:nucleotide-binding universal stress UspA family protein